MSEPEDPEHLLKQALRAQAVRAPHRDRTERAVGPDPATSAGEIRTSHPYGLLSGDGASSLAAESAALGPAEPPTVEHRIPARRGPSTLRCVLVLAVLLGLAAGSVIGVITLV